MNFYTKYVRPEKTYEKNSGKRITEMRGYVSAKDRITAIMDAGERLISSRAEMFDYQPGQEINLDDIPDPTMSKSYDPADASMQILELEQKLALAKEQSKMAEKPKEEQDPDDPEKKPEE